jgi:hypothetical protein
VNQGLVVAAAWLELAFFVGIALWFVVRRS